MLHGQRLLDSTAAGGGCDGGATEVACVPLSETDLHCTAPDLRSGDHYEFYLHGRDGSAKITR